MTLTAEREYQHIGETKGAHDHDFDLISELNRRLEGLWRYDQYIANADGKPQLQDQWRELKRQDKENVERLKQLVAEEIKEGCF